MNTPAELPRTRSERAVDILLAVPLGLLCHLAFALAVGTMAVFLAGGLQAGRGTLASPYGPITDSLLAIQFPLLHSYLLTARGRRRLARIVPGSRGPRLAITIYALITSLQLLATFWLWTPSGVVLWEPTGFPGVMAWSAYLASWVFLVRAIHDAGAGLQSGAVGWWSVLRGERLPTFTMPTRGLFRRCRQPIYLGFLLVLWTAPVWSYDRLLLVFAWTPYCVLAPHLKEQRFLRFYGAAFASYRATVPYLIPRFTRKASS